MDSKISLGAEKWVDVYRYETTQLCIDSLRAEGYRIIATSPHADDCLLDASEIEGKTAQFFGTKEMALHQRF